MSPSENPKRSAGGVRQPNLIITYGERLPSGLHAATIRLDDKHPDGARVEEPDPSTPILVQALESPEGLVRVVHAPFATPKAPPTWFVSVDESRASPPATNLVAFVGDELPAGTIVNRYRFASLGVPSERQAAAVRWYPRSGLVHQVFVAVDQRRNHLGSHIIYAALAFHHANRWPGDLHGDGRRTVLGQKLMAGMRHPQRFAPLTRTMPSMDGV